MQLNEMPHSMRVTACTHVISGERPVRALSFSNGLNLTCLKPDHGDFGELHRGQMTLGEAFEAFDWLHDLNLKAGQAMRREDGGIWVSDEVYRGPRIMTSDDEA